MGLQYCHVNFTDRCYWANLLSPGASKKYFLVPKRRQWRASDSMARTASNSFLYFLQPHLEPQPLRPNFTKPKG